MKKPEPVTQIASPVPQPRRELQILHKLPMREPETEPEAE